MKNIQCPTCGRETPTNTACPGCGRTAAGGSPPEAANWSIERPSPDVLAWAKQTFNEAEFLAALRETERGRGGRFEDFIDETERIAHGKE